MGNGVREGQANFKRQDVEPAMSTHVPSEVRAGDCWVCAVGLREELCRYPAKEAPQRDLSCRVLNQL